MRTPGSTGQFRGLPLHLDSVVQSCLTLHEPMDCNPPGFSVPGILQVRIREWVVISPSGGSPHPGVEPASPALAGDFFTPEPLTLLMPNKTDTEIPIHRPGEK